MSVVFDMIQPNIDESVFALGTTDCRDFYGDIEEELSLGMLEPLVKSAHKAYFVDFNHDGSIFTQRSHTDVLIYVINGPVI